APLGWIQSVAAHAGGIDPDRFVLGIPNYGVTPSTYCALADCPSLCPSSIATTTEEMTSCPFNVDTHFAPGRSLNCETPKDGRLFFDDSASLEERVGGGKGALLRGVTYGTVGSEPAGFFEMIEKYYPASPKPCAGP